MRRPSRVPAVPAPVRPFRDWLAAVLLCALAVLAATLTPGLTPVASALDVPELKGQVNDYAKIISAGTEETLQAKLAAFEDSDSTQVVILTIPSLEGDDLEEYSVRVAQEWGLGQQGRDNGVLLLIARKERLVRIEVGYGLEGRLTDLVAGRIVDYEITPYFKQGRYDEGVARGVDAITRAVRGEYKGSGKGVAKRNAKPAPIVPLIVVFMFFAAMFNGVPVLFRGLAGAIALPLLGLLFSLGLTLVLALVPVGFLAGLVMPLLLDGRNRHRGGGFGGGPFIGGGFGGFGGGSSGSGGFGGGGGGFGGGGASGRW